MISNFFQKRLSFKLNDTSSEAPEEVTSENILKTLRKTTKTQFQIFIVNFQTTFSWYLKQNTRIHQNDSTFIMSQIIEEK